MKTQSLGPYMTIEEGAQDESRKTSSWTIRSKKSDEPLGAIAWYAPWRQYCFFPGDMTLFNDSCLENIITFLRDTNRAHRERAKG